MQVTPLHDGGLAAEVTGVSFERALDAAQGEALRRAFVRHAVLCLRTGGLTPAQFLAVARIFGEPQLQLLREHRHPEHPEISYIASGQADTRGNGRRVVFGSHWHTDDSYMAVPCAATLLYANVIPERGGDTLFADMSAALDVLPPPLRAAVDGRRAVHTYYSRRNVSHVPRRSADEEAESPPVAHPLVRTHPESGRPALYLNPNRIERVEGMALDEGDALLDALLAHATQPRFVYRHRWRAADVVIWDNRCTMHKASDDYRGQRREMLRVLLKGTPPR